MRAYQEREGWYSAQALENIKTVLRHKFFSLIEGHIATREECEELLVPAEGNAKPIASIHKRSKRIGKHNMAKGALPPEDAAVRKVPIGGDMEGRAYRTAELGNQASSCTPAPYERIRSDGKFYEWRIVKRSKVLALFSPARVVSNVACDSRVPSLIHETTLLGVRSWNAYSQRMA